MSKYMAVTQTFAMAQRKLSCLILTLSQRTKFRHFQTGRACNFKLDENDRKFSKRVENTVGK